MGGIRSGRRRIRHVGNVEDFLTLDIRVLRRLGFLRPDMRSAGTLAWQLDGDCLAAASLSVDLRGDNTGALSVTFGPQAPTQVVALTAMPCCFGGFRYYFLCPSFGRRCEVLPLVDGVLASRQAHGLVHRSQSMSVAARLSLRVDKLGDRLLGTDGRQPPRGRKRAQIAEKHLDSKRAAREAYADSLRSFLGAR